MLLRGGKALGSNSKEECLIYLGRNFRVLLNLTNLELNDRQAGEIFLKEYICLHLKNNNFDKFNFLLLCIEKLYAFYNS